MVINQYDICWIDLDPTKGSELKKIRPCIVISPDEMNYNINTVIIAPLTSTSKNYPTHVKIDFGNREGWIVLDQLRCVDKSRLLKNAGSLNESTVSDVKNVIREMLVD